MVFLLLPTSQKKSGYMPQRQPEEEEEIGVYVEVFSYKKLPGKSLLIVNAKPDVSMQIV